MGWDWDSRNRTLFADRGMRQSVSAAITVPIDDVQYCVANYQFVKYVPLSQGWTLSFLEGIDYGAPLGNTTALPPYRQFFGGGPDNVRGFRESRLGPKDQFGNPYGGNLRITSQNELIFPMPAKWAQTARVSLFYDMGGVYQTGSDHQVLRARRGDPGQLQPLELHGHQALGGCRRAVAGAPGSVPLQLWQVPLNAQSSNGITTWGDETEGFQFSVGNAF